MMKKLVTIFALLLVVGSMLVIGQNADDNMECSFWCKVKQVLFGREEAAAGKATTFEELPTVPRAVMRENMAERRQNLLFACDGQRCCNSDAGGCFAYSSIHPVTWDFIEENVERIDQVVLPIREGDERYAVQIPHGSRILVPRLGNEVTVSNTVLNRDGSISIIGCDSGACQRYDVFSDELVQITGTADEVPTAPPPEQLRRLNTIAGYVPPEGFEFEYGALETGVADAPRASYPTGTAGAPDDAASEEGSDVVFGEEEVEPVRGERQEPALRAGTETYQDPSLSYAEGGIASPESEYWLTINGEPVQLAPGTEIIASDDESWWNPARLGQRNEVRFRVADDGTLQANSDDEGWEESNYDDLRTVLGGTIQGGIVRSVAVEQFDAQGRVAQSERYSRDAVALGRAPPRREAPPQIQPPQQERVARGRPSSPFEESVAKDPDVRGVGSVVTSEDTAFFEYDYRDNPQLRASQAVAAVVPDADSNPYQYLVRIGNQPVVRGNDGEYYPVGSLDSSGRPTPGAQRVLMTANIGISVQKLEGFHIDPRGSTLIAEATGEETSLDQYLAQRDVGEEGPRVAYSGQRRTEPAGGTVTDAGTGIVTIETRTFDTSISLGPPEKNDAYIHRDGSSIIFDGVDWKRYDDQLNPLGLPEGQNQEQLNAEMTRQWTLFQRGDPISSDTSIRKGGIVYSYPPPTVAPAGTPSLGAPAPAAPQAPPLPPKLADQFKDVTPREVNGVWSWIVGQGEQQGLVTYNNGIFTYSIGAGEKRKTEWYVAGEQLSPEQGWQRNEDGSLTNQQLQQTIEYDASTQTLTQEQRDGREVVERRRIRETEHGREVRVEDGKNNLQSFRLFDGKRVIGEAEVSDGKIESFRHLDQNGRPIGFCYQESCQNGNIASEGNIIITENQHQLADGSFLEGFCTEGAACFIDGDRNKPDSSKFHPFSDPQCTEDCRRGEAERRMNSYWNYGASANAAYFYGTGFGEAYTGLRGSRFFRGLSTVLQVRGGLEATSSYLFSDELNADFQRIGREYFDRAMVAEYIVPRAVCDYDELHQVERDGESTIMLEVSPGVVQTSSSISAERSPQPGPILCSEELPCRTDEECSEDGFCEEDGERLEDGYFYRISWAVTAPTDESFTPYLDENGVAIKFNVQIFPEGSSQGTWLYRVGGAASENTLQLANGQSDRDTIVGYSPRRYNKVCIKFGAPPRDLSSDPIYEHCADPIVESALGQVQWERGGRPGSSGGGNAIVRSSDAQRVQI